jgi:hypothetical protein
MGFSAREIGRLAQNGFEVSDLEPDVRASWQSQIIGLVDNVCSVNE